MLVVGLRGKGQAWGNGMSFDECQTHMSLWCLACSPLVIGCDIRALDSETASLLLNREVLAVNQDPLGRPARRVKLIGPCQVWRKPLADAPLAIALMNRDSVGTDFTLKAPDIGLLDTPKLVRNLWQPAGTADFKAELTQRLQPHETI